MRKLTQILTPGLLAAAMLFLPAMVKQVAAQDPTPAAQETQEDKDCNELYQKFLDEWGKKTVEGQKAGYPIGKQYMEKCGSRQNELTAYVKKQLDKYEALDAVNLCNAAIGKASVDDAFKTCKPLIGTNPTDKQIIALKPDDLILMLDLGTLGAGAFQQQKNAAYVADSTNYLKQAAQKIDGGGAPANGKWDPFTNRDAALGWANYYLGVLSQTSAPADAIGYFYKSNQVNVGGTFPKAYSLFYMAEAYNADVEKAREGLKVYDNQPPSAESKAAFDHWYQMIDRAEDYYARAYQAAKPDPKASSIADSSLEQLTIFYKVRHADVKDAAAVTTGVNELIADVAKKPMPDPKSELPALPATPAPTAGTTPAGTTTPAPGTTTGGTKPPLSGGATTPPAKATGPATPTPPVKPPTKGTRNSHRKN
jgi:hypothetical protein